MISVIIPAHNEEKVIATTLVELIDGVFSGELEVIVVCNGCSDNTVGVVGSFGPAIKFIETTIQSKANALNLGDAAAKGFPRVYQDADVVLSLDAIRQIAKVLQPSQFLAAAPRMQMEFRNASRSVRAYYEVWQQLPYVQEGMVGVGVYALSEKGRKRFDKFPNLIADDGFIRTLFTSQERISVETCTSIVRAPENLSGLLKIKTRSRLGRYELKKKYPELLQNEPKQYAKAMIGFTRQIHLWPKILIYLYVNFIARIRARRYARVNGFTGWERDDSSREVS